MPPLKICSVSAELAPYASTGGLGEMCAALHRNLRHGGHEARSIVPYHESAIPDGATKQVDGLGDLVVSMGDREYQFSIVTPTDSQHSTVFLIRCPELFDRPSLYTSAPDEAVRFGFFCRAVLETFAHLDWSPDILHLHDWHTALIPLLLQTTHGGHRRFTGTRTVLTLHNVSYQGSFSPSVLADLGLSGYMSFFSGDDLEQGRVRFLTTGILYADQLTTVSRTYAAEIQQPETGAGLDRLLRARSERLIGIVNGIDTDEWNPVTDPRIAANYSANDLSGKRVCKTALLEEFRLTVDSREPVLGIVSRLTHQKGFDLVSDGLRDALGDGCGLVVLGSGEPDIESTFDSLRQSFPGRVGVYTGYDPDLAHRVQAGADIVLMPSRWEPCGLSQLYALRYATVPLVRRTGGLADTVVDAEAPDGTGFIFDEPSPEAFQHCLARARHRFRSPQQWQALMLRCMSQDWSWTEQIGHYVALYEQLTR